MLPDRADDVRRTVNGFVRVAGVISTTRHRRSREPGTGLEGRTEPQGSSSSIVRGGVGLVGAGLVLGAGAAIALARNLGSGATRLDPAKALRAE